MKYFKLKIAVWSSLIFIFGVIAYYLCTAYIQNLSTSFCKERICLPWLNFESYLALLISIIGIVIVVYSIDAWRLQQGYLDKKALLIEGESALIELKEQIIFNYLGLGCRSNVHHNTTFFRLNLVAGKSLKKLDYNFDELNNALDDFIKASNTYASESSHINKEALINFAKTLLAKNESLLVKVRADLKELSNLTLA